MSFSVESLPMLKMPRPARRERTLEEYLRFDAKAKERYEFIDKHFVKMAGAKAPHNIIMANMTISLGIAIKRLPKKYIVFSSEQKVYLPPLDEVLYPDVLAVCEKPLFWDDDQHLLINPLVIVEVLSKSTRGYDRGDKFMKYNTLDPFREYVLVEQDRARVETWFREEPGLWRETAVEGLGAKIALRSMGIELSLADIYDSVELA